MLLLFYKKALQPVIQQCTTHNSNAYFLLLVVDQDIKHSYLKYLYMVILRGIYVAPFWPEY